MNELAKYGKECKIVSPVSVDGIGVVSSSIIRGALKCGDIQKAN